MAKLSKIGPKVASGLQMETLQLVMEIEDQSRDLVKFCESCQSGDRNFGRFRDALRRVDDFYLFVDMVERKLEELDHPKKDLLKVNVIQIRWKVFSMSLSVLDSYTEEFLRDAEIIPYGRKEVFQSRLRRIVELEEHFKELGATHGLAPVDPALVARIKQRLEKLIEIAPALTEFSREEAMAAEVAAERAIHASRSIRRRRVRQEAQQDIRLVDGRYVLEVRKIEGRPYVSRNLVVEVTQLCKQRGFDLDELARRCGMHRLQMTLMLNGQDSVPQPIIKIIEAALSEPVPTFSLDLDDTSDDASNMVMTDMMSFDSPAQG